MFCKKCTTELTDFNWSAARRKKNHYICKSCAKTYLAQYYGKNFKIIRERAERAYTKDNFIYGSKKWASQYLAAKRYWDKKRKYEVCDFAVLEFLQFIQQPCSYCKDVKSKRGLDRIDNSKGHVKTNVVVACQECNECRNNNFSHSEMWVIGQAIALVKEARYV